MEAAGPRRPEGRGAPGLLAQCAAFDRLTQGERRDARARVEFELGDRLAELLLRALVGGSGRRAALLL